MRRVRFGDQTGGTKNGVHNLLHELQGLILSSASVRNDNRAPSRLSHVSRNTVENAKQYPRTTATRQHLQKHSKDLTCQLATQKVKSTVADLQVITLFEGCPHSEIAAHCLPSLPVSLQRLFLQLHSPLLDLTQRD